MSRSRAGERPAGLAWRAGARVVDLIAFTWLSAFVLVELDQRLFGGDPLGRRPSRLAFDTPRAVVLGLLLALAYETIPMVFHGATLGKAMLGLRVRNLAGGHPSVWAAAFRSMVVYLPPMLWGTPGLAITALIAVSSALPASGRGVHDRLAATVVVTVGETDNGMGSAGDGKLS